MAPLLMLLLLLPLMPPILAGAASPARPSGRACVVSFSRRSGAARHTCLDIRAICERLRCGAERVCALDPAGTPTCLPDTVGAARNCGSEDDRLAQPCPDGAAVLGFGRGCTFCEGTATAEASEAAGAEAEVAATSQSRYIGAGRQREPWGGPSRTVSPRPTTVSVSVSNSFSSPQKSRQNNSHSLKACVVVHIGSGEFKEECVDIASPCQQRNCSSGTVCGLNLNEQIECFPESVKEFENCGSEEFRLSQPCPADAGIRGFGRGCTFCEGGFPFVPSTDMPAIAPRACVYVHIGSGEFKKECIDISSPCKKRDCPAGTVCGLNLKEQIECFPESVKDFENCGSEEFRLSQPCPADTGIRGFGHGCTFCGGSGNPFTGRTVPRACVVVHIGSGEFKAECVDISSPCQQRSCPTGTVCGLNLKEQIECFPESARGFENCGPEEFRQSQPCPADTGILGFGQGCTFCEGGFPFEPPTDLPATAPNACVVIHTGSGRFKRECYDISAKCARQNCPSGTVCGLDLSENTVCFPLGVKQFENCGSDSFRLEQPCPADAGIRGFGQGCTFCVGANPWQTRPTLPVRPPIRPRTRPPIRPPTSLPTRPTTRPVIRPPVACINRRLPNGQLRRGCRDITADCRRLACRSGFTCALDRRERPRCFPPLQLQIRNCGQPARRLARPCPDGTEVIAYGAGCTFCQRRTGRACVARPGGRSQCVDISQQCARIRCGAGVKCVLNRQGRVICLPPARQGAAFCGTEQQRLRSPCGYRTGSATPIAYGPKCNYCY